METDTKGMDMNKDQQKEDAHKKLTSSPASGGWGEGGNLLFAFTEGVVSGLRPVGPALLQLLMTTLGVLAVWLLGGAAIYAAHTFGSPISHLLMNLGDSLLVLGALGMLIGSVRAWGKAIQMILLRTGGTVDSTGGEHDDH